jgi:transcriptional regulator of acetoin/glycerol metabolism
MLCVSTLLDADEVVLPEHLPSLGPSQSMHADEAVLAGRTLAEIEREAVRRALLGNNGKRAPTAEQLGVSEKTIYNLIKRYNL